MKKASKYVLLNTGLLDDYRAVNLPDNAWRKMIEAIFQNPKNIRCEATEARYTWQILRKKLSPLVFSRDENICKMCGSTERLEIDHIIPLSRGGSNELTNLQILCRHCNSVKRDK